TGEVPFRGTPHMVVQQVLHDEPVPPRRLNDRVPRDLETVCLKAMAKEPGRRYETAAELRDDLHRWLAGESIRARPVSRPERVWRWCARNPLGAGLAAAVATLLLVVAVGATLAALTQRDLAQAAHQARVQAEEAASLEQVQRRRAEELLEQQYTDNAGRLLDDGGPYGALPGVVEWPRLAGGDPRRGA